MVSDGLALELINGAGAILDACFLLLIGFYLVKEHRRRGLAFSDWLGGLPPSMHFAVAVAACDAGILLRTSSSWVWRRFYAAGPFPSWLLALLILGGVGIVVGMLCKIRSISRPDYGDAPWLIALYALTIFLFLSCLSR